MELCGTLLKTERLKKHYSMSDISRMTKIRVKYIERIEENDFSVFPAKVYIYGFVQLYALCLGLKGKEVVELCKSNLSGEEDMAYQLVNNNKKIMVIK